MFAPNLHR